MATKKKTEEITEAVESIEAVEEKVATSKKTTSKKSTSTKKKAEAEVKAEEPKVEEKKEVKVEEPAPVVEEVKEEKKVEKKEEVKVEEPKSSSTVIVLSPAGIYSFKGPGLDQPKGKIFPKGSKLIISEKKGNWAKVGEDKWILLGGTVAEV